jgi:phage repressor protein C with HTH and peptisase S24 domain
MGRKKDTETLPTPGARLRAARRDLGLSQTEMANAVGVTQSTIGAYESAERDAPLPVLLAAELRLHVNHDWVLTGRGPRIKTVTATQPQVLITKEQARALAEREGSDAFYVVPYMRDPASAGAGLIMEEDVAGYCIIHSRVAPRPDDLRCVRVQGESMAPSLTDGSIVAVDTTPVPMHNIEGRIVCARTEDGSVVIKRLRLRDRYALLFSDNPDRHAYPPLVIDLRETPDPIIGQVIWAWVDLR